MPPNDKALPTAEAASAKPTFWRAFWPAYWRVQRAILIGAVVIFAIAFVLDWVLDVTGGSDLFGRASAWFFTTLMRLTGTMPELPR